MTLPLPPLRYSYGLMTVSTRTMHVNVSLTVRKVSNLIFSSSPSLIVRDKVTRQFPAQTTTIEEIGKPKRNRTEVFLLHQPNALPLGHRLLPHSQMLVRRKKLKKSFTYSQIPSPAKGFILKLSHSETVHTD